MVEAGAVETRRSCERLRNSFMWKSITPDKMLALSLLGMTAVTGLIDAVSFLSLGHVFTANMTGNVVFLAFASAGVSELSVPRSFTALLGFLLGAVFGGRIMARATGESQIRLALVAFGVEIAFLLAATLCAIGYSAPYSPHSFQLYALIVLTAVAMGTRNAAARKLAVPDLTTTVLTLTITGLAADSFLAHGNSPRWQRRLAAVLAMFVGAAMGAILLRHSVFAVLALAVATSSLCSIMLFASIRRNPRIQVAEFRQ
jgi:uncharacterized membrane protein YoaK (UPF0700 family)